MALLHTWQCWSVGRLTTLVQTEIFQIKFSTDIYDTLIFDLAPTADQGFHIHSQHLQANSFKCNALSLVIERL